jgi:hypothetical protein
LDAEALNAEREEGPVPGAEKRQRRRPIGVSILAVINLVGAGGVLVSTVLLVLDFFAKLGWLRVVRNFRLFSTFFALLAFLFFIAFLLLASGVGMWVGRKWAWFLGTVFWGCEVVVNITALIRPQGMFGSVPEGEHGTVYYLLEHGVGAIVGALIYLYLFKANVLHYFGLAGMRKWKPVLAGAAVCLVLLVLPSLGRIPEWYTSLEQLGEFSRMQDRGEYGEVLPALEEYVREHPESVLGWSLLGWTCLNLDRDDRAFDCFANAVELSPNWDDAHVGLGVLCRRQGDFDRAREHYFRAIEINRYNAVALSNLAFIEVLEGNDEAAVDYGEQAWAIRQDLPATAETLAIAYHYLGDVEKRDFYYRHAERLGHEDLEGIRDVFEGRLSIR